MRQDNSCKEVEKLEFPKDWSLPWMDKLEETWQALHRVLPPVVLASVLLVWEGN